MPVTSCIVKCWPAWSKVCVTRVEFAVEYTRGAIESVQAVRADPVPCVGPLDQVRRSVKLEGNVGAERVLAGGQQAASIVKAARPVRIRVDQGDLPARSIEDQRAEEAPCVLRSLNAPQSIEYRRGSVRQGIDARDLLRRAIEDRRGPEAQWIDLSDLPARLIPHRSME